MTPIEPIDPANACVHLTGVGPTTCRAGVDYDSVKAGTHRPEWPCTNLAVPCASRLLPAAQLAANQKWFDELAEQGVRIVHPDDGWVDREANTVQFMYPTMQHALPAPGVLVALGTPAKWRVVMLKREVRQPVGGSRWAFVEQPASTLGDTWTVTSDYVYPTFINEPSAKVEVPTTPFRLLRAVIEPSGDLSLEVVTEKGRSVFRSTDEGATWTIDRPRPTGELPKRAALLAKEIYVDDIIGGIPTVRLTPPDGEPITFSLSAEGARVLGLALLSSAEISKVTGWGASEIPKIKGENPTHYTIGVDHGAGPDASIVTLFMDGVPVPEETQSNLPPAKCSLASLRAAAGEGDLTFTFDDSVLKATLHRATCNDPWTVTVGDPGDEDPFFAVARTASAVQASINTMAAACEALKADPAGGDPDDDGLNAREHEKLARASWEPS